MVFPSYNEYSSHYKCRNLLVMAVTVTPYVLSAFQSVAFINDDPVVVPGTSRLTMKLPVGFQSGGISNQGAFAFTGFDISGLSAIQVPTVGAAPEIVYLNIAFTGLTTLGLAGVSGVSSSPYLLSEPTPLEYLIVPSNVYAVESAITAAQILVASTFDKKIIIDPPISIPDPTTFLVTVNSLGSLFGGNGGTFIFTYQLNVYLNQILGVGGERGAT